MGHHRTLGWIGGAVLTAIVGFPAAAAAQDGRGDDPWGGGGGPDAAPPEGQVEGEMAPEEPAGKPGRAWLDLAFYTDKAGGTRGSSVSPVLRGRYVFADMVGAELQLPMAGARISNGSSDGSFMVGNLTLTGLYVTDVGDLHIEAGLTLGLPTAMDPDEPPDGENLLLAFATRGQWEGWHWINDTFSLIIPARAEYIGDGFGAGVELGIGPLIPIGDAKDAGIDTEAVLQARGWGGYASDILRAGVRIQSVVSLTGDGDKHQAAIEPFVMYTGETLLAGGGFLVNLDEPFGYVDNGLEIWGLRIYAGAQF